MHWLSDKIEALQARVDLALAGRGTTLVTRTLQVLATMRTTAAVASTFQALIDEEAAQVATYRASYERGLREIGALRDRIEQEHPEWLPHSSPDAVDPGAGYESVEMFDVVRTRNRADDRLKIEPGQSGKHERDHLSQLVDTLNRWIPEGDGTEDWATPFLEVKDRWEFALRHRRLQVAAAPAAAARLLQFATIAHEESPRTAAGILGWIPLSTSSYGALYEDFLGVPRIRDQDLPERRKLARRKLRSDLRAVAAELRFRLLDIRSTSSPEASL